MDKKSYKFRNKIELLAPAKDFNCAKTAIDCGADAVYIGASQYGARKKAGNSIEDIKKIVEYAHLFGVKIYVTLNTLLFDDELNSAETLIKELYEANTDALIIQDLGILNLNIPPIPIHASTQCHNLDIEKIKFLQSLNIERIILPRELNLQEIENIKKQTNAELEFFVHGALCVSYSGQCYLSQSIGGRSANRGECAQPCRNKYSLIDEKGNCIIKDKYLLSLKDFCLIDNLESLIEAGISSLKIEGRLKDEDYIKTVVSAYRKKLDLIAPKTSNGEIITDFKPDVTKVFNRGFTKYNIEKSDINSTDTPKNKGEFMGKVKSVFKNGFEIENGSRLNSGDGICAFVNNELQGSVVTKTDKNKIFILNNLDLKSGDKIYRNLDSNYIKYAKSAKVQRKLPIDISTKSENGKIIIFAALTESETNITIEFKNNFEPAKNKEQAKETLKKQLSKLGNTIFKLEKINIDGDIPFIPVSELNEFRRNLVQKLETKILNDYKQKKRDLNFAPIDFPKNIENDYKLNITNQKSKELYQKAGLKTPATGYEKAGHIKNATLMQTKNCLRKLAGICLKECKNNNKLFLKDTFGNKYPLKFNCKNCVMEILDYE